MEASSDRLLSQKSVGGNSVSNTNARACVQKQIDSLPFHKTLFMASIIGLANAGDAVEISKAGFFLPDLPDITAFQGSLLTASVFAGMFFGGLFLGQLSDRIGRRKAYLITLGANSLAGLGSTLFPDLGAVIFFRFIGGVAIGGSMPVIFTYGAELFPSEIRGKAITFIGSFFMVGSMYVALVAWAMLSGSTEPTSGTRLTGDMRLYVAMTCIPVWVACISAYFVLPESPLFLYDRGRYEELLTVLTSFYGASEADSRPIRELIASSNSRQQMAMQSGEEMASGALRLSDSRGRGSDSTSDFLSDSDSGSAAASVDGNIRTAGRASAAEPDEETEGDAHAYLSCSQLHRTLLTLKDTHALLKQAALLAAVYVTLAFSSYGISTWISVLYENVGITSEYKSAMIFASAQLPANIITLYFIDSIGRKKLLVSGLGLGALCAAAFGLDDSNITMVILFSALFNMFTVIAWNSLNCFSVESFPTRIRSSTMGILGAAGRIAAGSAQFTNAYLAKDVEALLSVTSVMLLIGAACGVFLVECDQRPLLDPGRSLSSTCEGGDDNAADESSEWNPLARHAYKTAPLASPRSQSSPSPSPSPSL